jgi:hypothetical protein
MQRYNHEEQKSYERFRQRIWRSFFFVLTLTSTLTFDSAAQFLESPSTPTRAIEGGLLFNRFKSRDDNSFPDSLRSSYDEPIPIIGYRDELVSLYLSYWKFKINGIETTELTASVKAGTDFRLTGKEKTFLAIPIALATDYTRVERSDLTRGSRFDVGSVGIGAGLKFKTDIGFARLGLEYLRFITYSTVSFGSGIGYSHVNFAEATFAIPHALGDYGLVIAYRYRDQDWLMDNKQYNYFSRWHGVSLGVMF